MNLLTNLPACYLWAKNFKSCTNTKFFIFSFSLHRTIPPGPFGVTHIARVVPFLWRQSQLLLRALVLSHMWQFAAFYFVFARCDRSHFGANQQRNLSQGRWKGHGDDKKFHEENIWMNQSFWREMTTCMSKSTWWRVKWGVLLNISFVMMC